MSRCENGTTRSGASAQVKSSKTKFTPEHSEAQPLECSHPKCIILWDTFWETFSVSIIGYLTLSTESSRAQISSNLSTASDPSTVVLSAIVFLQHFLIQCLDNKSGQVLQFEVCYRLAALTAVESELPMAGAFTML